MVLKSTPDEFLESKRLWHRVNTTLETNNVFNKSKVMNLTRVMKSQDIKLPHKLNSRQSKTREEHRYMNTLWVFIVRNLQLIVVFHLKLLK